MPLPTAQLGANLSDTAATRAAIRAALRGGPADGAARPAPAHATFVCEALLIYVPPAAAAALLAACIDEAEAAGCASATICFADRLPGVDGCAEADARQALAAAGGWELDRELAAQAGARAAHGRGEVEEVVVRRFCLCGAIYVYTDAHTR